MTSGQLAALAAISVIWGASFLFIRVLVEAGMEPLGVSGARTALAVVVLAPVAFAQRNRFPRDRRTWLALGGLGILNFALPWTLFSIGQQHVPSGVGSIVNAANPLWTAVVSTLVIKTERLSTMRTLGLVVGFAGVVLLMQSRITGFDAASLQGTPPMLLATICYAFAVGIIRRWMTHIPAVPLTVGQIGAAAIVLLPSALATGAYDHVEMGWPEWGSVLALGALGSGLTVVLYMWFIAQVGAVRASVATYLMPPIAIGLGWLLLDEALEWPMAAGLALIIAGVALAQGVRFAWVTRWRAASAASSA